MENKSPATRAPLPFAGWQALTPTEAAREVHERVGALPDALRRAALAHLRPEKEMAAEFGRQSANGAGAPSPRSFPDDAAGAPHPQRNANLAGVPYFVKDLFDIAGLPTSAGSPFLAKVRPTPARSSSLVRRLNELGAVFAGKTHLVEFAAGLTGENRTYGDCPHPRFANRLAGGSSSGSAALVGAGVVPLALGTDTGGSVRVPAAFCGGYGFRMAPGHEWIRDAFPLSPTCDTAGWFTANPGDMRTALNALLGQRNSPRDETERSALAWSRSALAPDAERNAARAPRPQQDSEHRVRNTARAPRGCFLTGADLGVEAEPDLERACSAMAARFAPPADDATRDALRAAWTGAVDTYATIVMHEAHAIHRDWLAPYRENYDPVIWQRISDGGRFPVEQLAQARENLGRVRESWRQFFATHDFLVLPCAPFPALRKADCTAEARRAILRLTAPASLGGLPALTIPVPLASGLTGGLQIIAARPDSGVFDWVLAELTR